MSDERYVVDSTNYTDTLRETLGVLLSEQSVHTVLRIIEAKQMEVRFRAQLHKLQLDLAAVNVAQDKDVASRDKDREAASQLALVMIACGHPKEASQIFTEFMNNRPDYARQIIDMIR